MIHAINDLKKTGIVILLLFGFTVSFCQQADNLYDNLSYQDAIDKYEAILNKNSKDAEAIYNLANAYRLNNETVKAEKWFKQAVEGSEKDIAKFYYAQMLLMNGKPNQAKEWFSVYKNVANDQDKELVVDFIALCDKISKDQIESKYYDIKLVAFNSNLLDYSPMFYKEDIAFVSNRSESTGDSDEYDEWTDQKYTDLFVAKLQEGYKVEKFDKRINSKYHEGSGVFTADGNTFYFTRSNVVKGLTKSDNEQNVRLQIMKSEFTDGKWQKPVLLPFNNKDYSFAHPTLSPDGNTMIFASDLPMGEGGMDLYMTKKEGETWTEPINLGNIINTRGNEVFPSFDEKGKLYFSSNMHPGFGGLDLFVTSEVNSNWKKPENIGTPINSVKDDFGLITKDDLRTGYFSSSRTKDDQIYSFKKSGTIFITGKVVNCITDEPIEKAKVSITKNDRPFAELLSDSNGMFQLEVSKKIKLLDALATKTLFKNSVGCPGKETIKVGSNNEVILGIKPLAKKEDLVMCGRVLNQDCNYLLEDVKVTLINICNGEEIEVVTDENGSFSAPLEKGCKYKLIAEKDHFLTEVTSFKTEDLKKKSDCYEYELIMSSEIDFRNPNSPIVATNGGNTNNNILLKEGTVIELNHIYFDFDQYYIRRDAIPELEWVRKLMTDYPTMKVELSAHTDSRATVEYNNALSANRAKSAKNWLVENGVSADNIQAKGYGESKLKNKCSDGVPCTMKQHQRNRRVEFKVIKFDGEAIVSKEWKRFQEYNGLE